MKQIWITKKGPPEVLAVREAPDTNARAGEVRVRVRAAGINFADLAARQGVYPDAPPLPCVVGYEVSGVIDPVGAGATGFAEGDRIFAMPKFGGYTDTLVVPVAQVQRMPAKMSFEEAAALPVVYVTAHHMMLHIGTLRPGQRVFVHSVAGGVGLAALQLARARGCTVFGTASPSKHDYLRAAGCAYPIDSALEGADLVAAVRKAMLESGLPDKPNHGLDLVLDPVGGRSWTDSYKLLGPGGRVVAFGFSSIAGGKTLNVFHALGRLIGMKWGWSPMTLMNDNKAIAGCNMGHLFDRIDVLAPQFEALVAMYERDEIRPVVDRTFPFSQAAAAHHYLHDRKAKGKLLLVPD